MSRVRPSCVLAALVVVVLASVGSAAERQSLDPAAYPRIVNGLTTHAYPAVGALLRGDLTAPTEHLPITADTASLYCSGTLIGCRTFLTAGHCLDTPGPPEIDLLPDEAWVYLQHAGLFAVTSVARHPAYAYPVADLAVLKLGAPVTGIEPAGLNASDPNPFIPAAGTIVGFGRTGGLYYLLDPSTLDLGLKRTGRVETTTCLPGLSPNPDGELVCYDFLDPIGPPGDDSAICHGDSGGPLFLDLVFGPLVVGVTSGLTALSCLPEVHDYDANVYTYRDFILAELGEDETSTCGGLPPVGDPQVEVLGFDGRLDDVTPSASHTVGVGAGRNSVRFALNAIETLAPTLGSADRLFVVNMYVKAGAGASPADFDCKADAASVFGACIFDLPAAGTYSVFVQRVIGAGDYQLTATIFGGPPPVCGDGMRDFNEACDDGNSESCDGCSADCQLESGVCGDGILDPQCEACDDGNLADGDCCTAICQFEPRGNRCAAASICDGAGVCLLSPCTGDCNDDRAVMVDEVVRGVSIALGLLGIEQCPPFDANANGTVTVEELVAAVSRALAGCPG